MQDFVESPILIKRYINMSVLFIDILDAPLGTKLVFWLVCPYVKKNRGILRKSASFLFKVVFKTCQCLYRIYWSPNFCSHTVPEKDLD